MPVSRSRRLTHKQSSQSKLERYNKGSVKDIADKVRQIDRIVEASVTLCGEVIQRTRQFVGIDHQYINRLIGGAVRETTELNRRLETYKLRLKEMVGVKTDITSRFMSLFGDVIEEMQNIDSGIYQPIFDVQEEINRFADDNSKVDVEEINNFVTSLQDLKGDKHVN